MDFDQAQGVTTGAIFAAEQNQLIADFRSSTQAGLHIQDRI